MTATRDEPRPEGGISQLLGTLAAFFTFYLAISAVRRVFLSPLSDFPGPKLAALTNWYEFYYDVIKGGKFTTHIQKLHKKYGPIIRITPTELHIDDPEYFDTLYGRGATSKRDKYLYFSARFGYASDAFSTASHDLHRNRRKAISPFFSAGSVAEFQPTIREKVHKLCEKLGAAQDGQVVRLSRAMMALTTDIITDYAFAKSYDQLDAPDFEDVMHEALMEIYVTGHFALHFPIVFPILDVLPEWFVRWGNPAIMPVVGLRHDLARRIKEIREGINQGHKTATHQTIFHELIESNLPPEEKTDARLGDEAQLIIGAGIITTSWALGVASFHLASNAEILAKLRKEMCNVNKDADWRELEKLPYLNACVHESIRLSHGIVTRDPRLAPDEELQYKDWTIPKNTPVSMTTYDILMNEEVFPEPSSFIPDRWISNPDLQRYFVPFGKGTRQCLGINLAMAELYITIANVFDKFDFKLYETDESDVRMEHALLVPYPKWDSKGVRVTVDKASP